MNFRKNAVAVPNSQRQVQRFSILLINFIGTLGFSIVLPFLVFLVKDFGGNAIVFGIFVCNISCIPAHRSTNLRKMV
jgi:hypothetical protein